MRDFLLRMCLRVYPSASRERDGRAIVDLAYELSAQGRVAFLREVGGVLKGGIRARGRVLRLRLTGDPQTRRDAYLGLAATVMAVGYLCGALGHISFFARGAINFAGSVWLAAEWALQVGGVLLLAFGFAVIAVAFLGEAGARDWRLRRGAFMLAGGYGLMLVGGGLSLLYYHPTSEPALLWGITILPAAANLPAVVAALLAASAFARSQSSRGAHTAARNRRLGWASTCLGLDFALLLSPLAIVGSPGWLSIAADLAALVAAGVAAFGFFRAARAYRRPSPGRLPKRESILAMAATLFLLYRMFDLAYLGRLASWLWELEYVALALAALVVAVGLVASRQSLLRRDHPSLVTGED